jgi:pantoate--beta-alanine ligase
MGAIHNGHLKLIQRSNNICDVTVCSIFVNPTQFNNKDDYKKYPATVKKDIKKLTEQKCNIVYTPDAKDLYGNNIIAKKFNFGNISNVLEGKYRPGHFDGMATIVEKLFKIIKPTKAFFGQKDLQQLQIVKLLVSKMNANIEIIGVPTVRESSGLAKSSRNQLLSAKEQESAKYIYECLKYCKDNKMSDFSLLKKYTEKKLTNHKINLEYMELVNLEDMQKIKKIGIPNSNAICIAAYLNNVRLIDNIIL